MLSHASPRRPGTPASEPPLTYRLRHVSTGVSDTYSVRFMFPFMKGTKHHEVGEQTMSEFAPIVEDGDLGLALHSTADVKPGMYLWMKPMVLLCSMLHSCSTH